MDKANIKFSRLIRVGALFVLLYNCLSTSYAQKSSARNGYWLPVQDSIRIFLVFAEVLDDPNDNYKIPPNGLWQRGELPSNPETYFESELKQGQEIDGYITKYFFQASFGKYLVLGDYYPELVQIPYSELKGNGDRNVLEFLNKLPGDDILTKEGYSVKNGDFDLWSNLGAVGEVKPMQPDSLIDMVMIMWRFNSRIKNKPTSSGSVGPGYRSLSFKSMQGIAMMSRFLNFNSQAQNIIRHEYAHGLFGGNNFHTNGGYGMRVFMDFPGGFGMLSESDRSADTWNAWDRHRLGWKPDSKEFLISGIDSEGKEINTDLTVVKGFPQTIFLRDFISTGDALRIELPHVQTLNSNAPKQYLWIENRQRKEGNIDVRGVQEPGIYAFIQVGKDDTAKFGEQSNYIRGLQALGNYDFEYSDEPKRMLILDSWKENPFTGYNLLGRHPVNRPKVGGANREDLLVAGEWFMPEGVIKDGVQLDESFFNYLTYPLFGTSFDAFLAGDLIHIGENPPPTPVLTWQSYGKGASGAKPLTDPIESDLREIPLNGIRIEIVDFGEDGTAELKLTPNAWTVSKNHRWCGPLVVFDTLILDRKTKISLEQGYSAQQPQAATTDRHGNPIFAEPSFLRLMPGAVLILKRKARLILRNGSSIIQEEGSKIVLEKRARIIDKN